MELDKIAKAIIAVMKDVRGMEKNSKVGTGRSSYDGTKDQDVKEVFNTALAKHGLCMLPTEISEETQIDRWEEADKYNNGAMKTKQSVFTKVNVRYLLLHESGQSITIAGYGHGVDPADKGASKSTTYAMKNALLYSFMTPVGKIDDTDETHSNNIEKPAVKKAPAKTTKPAKTSQAAVKKAITLISKSTTLEELKTNWATVKDHVGTDEKVIEAKDKMKAKLTKKAA